MPRLLCLFLLLTLSACTDTPSEPRERDLDHGTIVHLFQWPWASVGQECTEVLGPTGVAAVQISPPQEHRLLPSQNFPWYQDYQPVSYNLTSRRGDRASFATMITQCHVAGVKVYADAVINHMAAGSRSFPAVPYEAADFHQCGRSISNYQDRAEGQGCDLAGLPDLATENPRVRLRIAAYLNDLLALGVDGFRLDAAKHIRGESFALLADRLETLLATAVTYVDSHDTQRGSTTLSYKDGEQHTLAMQLMLAHPYGTPLVMSSFAFESFDDGPPSGPDGITAPVSCGQGFVCEHRAVVPMIRFRNAVNGAPVVDLWATDAAIGFARGDQGYFAVNRASQPVTKTVQTGLKGTYTDLLSGQAIQTDGELTLTIPALSAIALIKE